MVQWIGDSLDGTLARVRGTERPTYGYYLDHLVDAIATAAIGIGLGLNTALALELGLDFQLVGLDLTVFDVVGLGIAGTMVVLLAGRSIGNLRKLAKREPGAKRRP